MDGGRSSSTWSRNRPAGGTPKRFCAWGVRPLCEERTQLNYAPEPTPSRSMEASDWWPTVGTIITLVTAKWEEETRFSSENTCVKNTVVRWVSAQNPLRAGDASRLPSLRAREFACSGPPSPRTSLSYPPSCLSWKSPAFSWMFFVFPSKASCLFLSLFIFSYQ